MLTDDLLASLFNGQAHLLAPDMATWLAASRRFTIFVTTYRDKIRKKLRATQEVESLLDLRLELETAYLLLQERALSLVYEPPQPGNTRRPDFAVSFTTSTRFLLEVTRVRPDPAPLPPAYQPDLMQPRVSERLIDTICGKLGQFLPHHPNILVVGVAGSALLPTDLRASMLRLQQRAERNDVAFFHRHHFRDRSHFFQQYQRVSEVLVRGSERGAGQAVITWVNPQAKQPLPSKVRTVLYRSQRGS